MSSAPPRGEKIEGDGEKKDLNHDSEKVDGVCLGCKVNAIAYYAKGCGHACFCKSCAMKCATGGKCKVCGERYWELGKLK